MGGGVGEEGSGGGGGGGGGGERGGERGAALTLTLRALSGSR